MLKRGKLKSIMTIVLMIISMAVLVGDTAGSMLGMDTDLWNSDASFWGEDPADHSSYSVAGTISQQWEFFFFVGTCLVIYVIMFIIWILIAVWVYRDAKERGMSAGVWVLIVLLIGIIGLIVYLVVRTDKPAYPQGVYYQQQPSDSFEKVSEPVFSPGADKPKKSKISVHFMGIGMGEKMDKWPLFNRLPRDLRGPLFAIIVVLLVMAAFSIAGMVGNGDEQSDPNILNPRKLDEYSDSGSPISDYLDEFTSYSTTLGDVMSRNGTFLVGVVTLTLDWTDEPDSTELGRVRENQPDNFQLEVNVGGNETWTVQSAIVPNSRSSSGGSGQIMLDVNISSLVNGYVAVGNMSGKYIPDEVIYADSINIVVYLYEAEDKYASGPAALKWNDVGNDFSLSVSVSGLIVPDA